MEPYEAEIRFAPWPNVQKFYRHIRELDAQGLVEMHILLGFVWGKGYLCLTGEVQLGLKKWKRRHDGSYERITLQTPLQRLHEIAARIDKIPDQELRGFDEICADLEKIYAAIKEHRDKIRVLVRHNDRAGESGVATYRPLRDDENL